MSSRKNVLKPYNIFDSLAMSTDLTSPVTVIQFLDNIGIQLSWTGNATGDFSVQTSLDYDQDYLGNVVSAGTWIEIASASAAGTADQVYFDLNQLSGPYIRTTFTNTFVQAAATALLDLTADITLTSVATGSSRNTNTFTIIVNAAAANPTDTVLADFTGTAAAITCTITPNDGTNNGATPVPLTTAELRELISTGAAVGKTVTITDLSSLRALQTATGGGATDLANGGEGDGVIGTFSGGTSETGVLTGYVTAKQI